MDNNLPITVGDLIKSTTDHLAPHARIIEDRSGVLFSGPITAIPEQFKKREYVSMVYTSNENMIVFRVKEVNHHDDI